LALGNRERSVPTSASRISAARWPTPGIVGCKFLLMFG
jgi:hypothetical protein